MIKVLPFIVCDACLSRLAEVVSMYALLVEPQVRQTFISGARLALTCPRCGAATIWKIKPQPASDLSENAA